MHVNFGSIGVRIAYQLLQVIEPYGNYYDENGHFSSWWSKDTLEKWNKADECTGALYNGTVIDEHGHTHVLQKPELMSFQHMRYAGSVKIAHQAFLNYMADHGSEAALPGLQADSLDQTFFLSAVQTYCYNKEPLAEYAYWYYYHVPIYSLLLNKVLSVIPEFAQAFNCPAGSPMANSTTSCPLA